jgi:hypothetical protein
VNRRHPVWSTVKYVPIDAPRESVAAQRQCDGAEVCAALAARWCGMRGRSGRLHLIKTRELLNDFASSRRLLAHTIIPPKQPGWMEKVDKAIAVFKPEQLRSSSIAAIGIEPSGGYERGVMRALLAASYCL